MTDRHPLRLRVDTTRLVAKLQLSPRLAITTQFEYQFPPKGGHPSKRSIRVPNAQRIQRIMNLANCSWDLAGRTQLGNYREWDFETSLLWAIDRLMELPSDQSSDRSPDRTIERWNDKAIEQSSDGAIDRAINLCSDRSVDRCSDSVICRPSVLRSNDRSTELCSDPSDCLTVCACVQPSITSKLVGCGRTASKCLNIKKASFDASDRRISPIRAGIIGSTLHNS